MRYLKRWFSKSLYRQVFTLIMALVLLLNVSLIMMAWVNFSLYNDNAINEKLNHQMRMLLDESLSQGRLVKTKSPIFSSYVATDKGVPHYLTHIDQPGVHLIKSPLVHVQAVHSPFSDGLLYLLYFPEQDKVHQHYQHNFVFYMVVIVLLLMFIGFISSLYLARLIVRPISLLQKNVEQATIQHPPKILNRSDEIGQLSRAFEKAFMRVNAFVDREHRFTRYASHELRTPVTIIQGALDVIGHAPSIDKALPALERISIANQDMQNLISTFLSLSREGSTANQQGIKIAESLEHCLNQQFVFTHEKLSCDIATNTKSVQKMYAQVVLQNILRNADSYCSGGVTVVLKYDRLMVCNSIDEESVSGYGHGIDIINAVCKKANWLAYNTQNKQRFCWLIYF